MKNKSLVIGLGIVGLISLVIVGAAVWYLVSPLFIDNVVEEEFPFEMPSADQLAQMSETELEAMEAQVLEVAAEMPDKVMDDPMPEPVSNTEPTLVGQGQFKDADSFHQGSGEAAIYQLPDGSNVLRFESFEVTNGPDLHVILSSNPNPTSRDDIGEDYVDLGSLKGNVGSQNYEIPADVDLTQYQSVVIYCMPFHVVFSTATLAS